MSKKQTKEFFLFALVGILNTAINFFSYTFLVIFHTPYLVANLIGYGVGMANSYFLNKQFVFQQRERNPKYLVKFIFVNILTVTVHSLLLYVFVTLLGLHKIYSQGFVTCITFLLNYAGNKLWTFK
ncbi:MAG: GtrA family protein [Bacillota bacterium]